MGLTSYKPLLIYGVGLTALGIAASAFQSATLVRLAVVAYFVGWAIFVWNLARSRKP